MTKTLSAFLTGLFALVLVSAPAWAGEAAMGTIKSTNKGSRQITLTQSGNTDRLYTVLETAKVRRDDKDANLEDFKAGDAVVVLYTTINKGMYAVDVCAVRKDLLPSMKGKIKEIRRGSQFVLTADGKDILVTLSDDGTIQTGASKTGEFSDLKAGTDVTVCYVKLPDGGIYAPKVSTFTETRSE